MSFKKRLLAVAAAGALSVATAVPAMALENEFHGLYRFNAFQTNFFNGYTYTSGATAGAHLGKDMTDGFMAEQRARVMYIAKANDDLKLVTHFELDSRFGGVYDGKYAGTSDAGGLDADGVSLETKNVYLDFNCPITGANFKVGIQPWADSYKSLFLLADMAGIYGTKKFGPVTASAGWFRIDDQGVNATVPGKLTSQLYVADGKFALSKDLTLGASYYGVQNDSGKTKYELLHMIGLNAAAKFGPAAVDAFGAYQFGDYNATQDISALLLGATGKVKAGPGSVNLAAIYLSGEKDTTKGDRNDFQTVAAATNYFNPANMWLLIRNGNLGNSSTSVLGTDNTVGGRGMVGLFAGYEGTAGKVFYNANVGYAMTAEQRKNAAGVKEDSSIGTEVNAQVGYKLYDNLSASAAVAYLILGKGMDSKTAGKAISGFGKADADDPYMVNVNLSYAF